MNKKVEKVEKFIKDGNEFLGKNLTFEDSKFVAWNNAVIRFLEKNYGVESETTKIFRQRDYSPPTFCECSHADFVKSFEIDLKTSIEELKRIAEEIDEEDNNECYKTIENGSVDIVLHLIQRFHSVAKQLKHRHESRATLKIKDEYDVQDLFHALLRIYFDDIRAEEWTPSYAGKCSRQDFLLKNENVVIEIKKTREGLDKKVLRDQLIVDIAQYKAHPNCKCLICFVYDPEERIDNPVELEKDLSTNEDICVIVKVAQR